jgi:predicted permease
VSLRLSFRLRAFAAKLRWWLSGQQHDGDFEEEIQEHLQLLAERFVAQGMPAEEAARAARLQFGNKTLHQEERRGLQTLTSLDALGLDLRHSVRTLWKSRGFAVVSIATLAVGIGASTAIFSVIDNVLLAPFPYKNASQIVFPRIHGAQQDQEDGRQGYTSNEVLEIGESNHVLDAVIATKEDLVLYKHGGGTEQLDAALVTPGTFEFFGVSALHGRLMQATDYEPGAPPVFVMRYKAWKERFNGDISVLNKTFMLNGTARTLVGIMPPRFAWYDVEVYIPERLTRGASAGPAEFPDWFLVGLLKPGVSEQQAEADLTVVARHLATIYPRDYPAQFSVLIRHLGDTVIGRFQETLYTVMAAVSLLLLIACGNVANLMLARATTREKEFALRTAIGAKRSRLVRLLMVESLVLAFAGAALGTLMAWAGLKALVAVMPQDYIPAETAIAINGPVLVFTLGISILTALVFGLVPALHSARSDCNDALRDSGKGVTGGFRGKWFRDVVVVVEVALSLTLLIGAGLLMRSFVALRKVNLGLRADHVFQTAVALPPKRYETVDQVSRFFRPLLLRLKQLPGVVNAAEASSRPPYNYNESKVEIVGKTHPEDWQTSYQQVSEEYFSTLRIELKRGRSFVEAEVNEARRVAVVNETFVRKYLPNENPIGQHLRLPGLGGTADPSFEIIGVVRDVTNRGLQSPIEPELWMPSTIAMSGAKILIVRTGQDPAALQDALQKEVWASDSGAAVGFSDTLQDRVNKSLYAGPRFGFLLMMIFGAIGLILVTVGVYSVLAYSTARKAHEIGIRIALGAKRADVLGLVVGAGLRLVIIGMLIGIGISLVLGRVIKAELTGVAAYDPLTLGATTVLLIVTATIACWVPAQRAAHIDPIVALRCD